MSGSYSEAQPWPHATWLCSDSGPALDSWVSLGVWQGYPWFVKVFQHTGLGVSDLRAPGICTPFCLRMLFMLTLLLENHWGRPFWGWFCGFHLALLPLFGERRVRAEF